MKNFLIIIFSFLLYYHNVFAWAPSKVCSNLPWCNDTWTPLETISSFIWTIIWYIAVVAVLAVMISGGYYLISMWEDEKIKKAKTWIIWASVWVVFSVSAWFIINAINNLNIT